MAAVKVSSQGANLFWCMARLPATEAIYAQSNSGSSAAMRLEIPLVSHIYQD